MINIKKSIDNVIFGAIINSRSDKMNKTFNQKRFKTMMRVANVIALIGLIFLSIAFVGAVVFFLVGLFIPADWVTFTLSEMNVTDMFDMQLGMYLSENVMNAEITLKSMLISGGIAMAAHVAFAWILFFMLKRVFGEVDNDKPFSQVSIKSLYIIAFAFIAGGFILPIFEFIVTNSIVNQIPAPYFDASYGLDVGRIFVGFLILILIGIFQYGAFLQTEYEETV